MSDLNLLPSQAKFQAEKIHIKGIINNFLWIFSGLWVLLLVGVFLFEFISNLSLKKFNNDYQKVLGQYQSLVENMALNQKVKYQAKVVAKVLSDRFEYGESMKLVRGLFPPDIVIKNLGIVEVKKFQVDGFIQKGEALSDLEEIVDDINSGLVEGVSQVEIKDVSVDSNEGWKFILEVSLK